MTPIPLEEKKQKKTTKKITDKQVSEWFDNTEKALEQLIKHIKTK